ncbi:MAG: tyrosine-type recombinase/integrase [Salibacteraceae bacterium]
MYRDEFQKYLQSEKRFSNHTVKAYITDLNQFSNFIIDNGFSSSIMDVGHKDIRSWLVSLVNESNISSNSINRKLSSLKTYFRFLQLTQVLSVNPTVKVVAPKMSKKLPEFVDQSSMNKLLNVGVFEEGFEGERNQLIIELLYQTGIRLSELIGISIDDIQELSKTVKVLGKRNKQRLVPLNAEIIKLCVSYLKHRNEIDVSCDSLIVTKKGKKAYPKMIYNIVNSYLAKVSTISKKSPHVLRHTFATHMLNNGADLNTIKELLGHANLSATQIYTHNSFEKLKTIYNQAHPRA